MEQRDSRYDLIRSIAIILIVFIHSMGMLDGKAPAGWSPIRVEYALLKCLISPGVHLFLLLSGALLLGKTEPIGRFYRKRLRRILIPFILWSAVVYLLTGRWSFFKSVWNAHRDYRRLRREEDPSPFEEERNNIGLYDGSIVLKFFLSRRKLRWSDIEREL